MSTPIQITFDALIKQRWYKNGSRFSPGSPYMCTAISAASYAKIVDSHKSSFDDFSTPYTWFLPEGGLGLNETLLEVQSYLMELTKITGDRPREFNLLVEVLLRVSGVGKHHVKSHINKMRKKGGRSSNFCTLEIYRNWADRPRTKEDCIRFMKKFQ